MKALFVTTSTMDVDSLVNAWDCWNETKSTRIKFNHIEPQIDNAGILKSSIDSNPDVIFYIGGAGPNMPSLNTFHKLKELAPLVNLCCDAGDHPYYPYLQTYKDSKCFDLQVTLDGCYDAPVDFVTVTPVDPTLFSTPDYARNIHCGFSGNFGRPARQPNRQPRNQVVVQLNKRKLLTLRDRNKTGDYEGHVEFTRKCLMVLNCAWRGSGIGYHVKGRVLEAARAGCSLLENEGAQTEKWLPKELFFTYDSIDHAASIIKNSTVEDLTEKGNALREYVKDRYHPREIYGAILKEIGLVGTSLTATAI